MKFTYCFLLLLVCALVACNQKDYKKDTLLFEDTFEDSLTHWVVETNNGPQAKAEIKNGKLIVDANVGITVWLNQKLSGNISIEYTRKVVMDSGQNDRLSDLNQFWMAQEPDKSALFKRNGTFEEYDSLQLYYFGMGGNRNTTTRFRKYLGTGEKPLITDLQEEEYLLKPNKTYHVKTICYNGLVEVFIDGQRFISYQDENPLKSGYFGFRTTESRHEIDNLKIYRLQ